MDYEYEVYTSWEGSRGCRVPVPVTAGDPDAAAQARLDMLGDPEKYTGIAVVDSVCDEVHFYTVEPEYKAVRSC